MAITKTGNIFKGFVFDGISSKDYGVYISGDGVYNSPERDVEMIEIPGRNGSYALDGGRFRNIEVTYPAGLFGDSEADFAEGISRLRNALASRRGYCRLTDDYNPDEYRLAIYRDGLEVSPEKLKAGEFSIVFDCKPQRFLTSGETGISVEDGDTITNPTLFDAAPLLKVVGNGTVSLHGEKVNIVVAPLGRVDAFDFIDSSGTTLSVDFGANVDPSLYNPGDTIYLNAALQAVYSHSTYPIGASRVFGESCSDQGASVSAWAIETTAYKTGGYVQAKNITFEVGVSKSVTLTATIQFNANGVRTLRPLLTITYDGATGFSAVITPADLAGFNSRYGIPFGGAWIDSTMSTISDTLYIDLDIGEAYMYDTSGEIVSLNDRAEIPASLPVLVPGENEIGIEGSISSLEIVPRWWEV